MSGRRRGRLCAVALLAATPLSAAGCGGDKAANGRQTITVQLVPAADVAPVYLGMKKGFFRQQKLDLKIQTAQGGAEIVPLVLGGDVQVGYSNTPTLLIAASKGLPLEIVAPGGASPKRKLGGGEDQVAAVMVKKDGPIRTAQDLKGRTVAVNTIKSLSDVTTSAALEKRGIDHKTVKYVEVPLPDMAAALDAGRVDAIFTISPFKTQAERSGRYRSILFPLFETRPGQVDAAYFASKRWASENPDVLGRFLSALRRSMLYAASHEAEMRQTVAGFTKLPAGLARTIPIGDRRPDCNELRASAAFLAQAMTRYGALDKSPDLGALIRPGFCAP